MKNCFVFCFAAWLPGKDVATVTPMRMLIIMMMLMMMTMMMMLHLIWFPFQNSWSYFVLTTRLFPIVVVARSWGDGSPSGRVSLLSSSPLGARSSRLTVAHLTNLWDVDWFAVRDFFPQLFSIASCKIVAVAIAVPRCLNLRPANANLCAKCERKQSVCDSYSFENSIKTNKLLIYLSVSSARGK